MWTVCAVLCNLPKAISGYNIQLALKDLKAQFKVSIYAFGKFKESRGHPSPFSGNMLTRSINLFVGCKEAGRVFLRKLLEVCQISPGCNQNPLKLVLHLHFFSGKF